MLVDPGNDAVLELLYSPPAKLWKGTVDHLWVRFTCVVQALSICCIVLVPTCW